MSTTLDNLTIETMDKYNFLDKILIKKFVKNNIENLTDYTPGEENLLISLATGLSYSQLVLFKAFDKSLLKRIKKFLTLRLNYMPLNKIAKKAYFYLDEFYINNFVLAPRKETEILVEQVLKFINTSNKNTFKILDLCCGSGAIGLTVAKYSSKPSFTTLSDISSKAIKVAEKNKTNLEIANAQILQSNMFRDLKSLGEFDIIISNPPYIKSGDIANLDVAVKKFDPRRALDGGVDGLKFYREIAKEAKNFLTSDGYLFLEIGFNQASQVQELLSKDFYTNIIKDLSGNDRIVCGKLK